MITLDGGKPHSGSVPDVQLAPRDSQDEIQARIDRGESPVVEPGVLADW